MDTPRDISPIGSDHRDVVEEAMLDPEYRRAAARFERAEAIARVIIAYRIEHGLTQDQLANMMGMQGPAISRLESGTHQPNLETLQRFAEATGRRLVVGFEDEVGERGL